MVRKNNTENQNERSWYQQTKKRQNKMSKLHKTLINLRVKNNF